MTIMNPFVRACLYGLAGAAAIGVVSCSDPLSNGYGGWYWQMPEISSASSPSPAAKTENTGNNMHANTAPGTASGNSHG